MNIQTINVGTTANDGTGDHLRDAFIKVNANFLLFSNYTVIAETVSRTLLLTDSGCVISVDSPNPVVITVPPNSSVNFPVGAAMIFYGIGAGEVSFIGGLGVGVNSADAATKIRAQYGVCSLIQIASNSWILAGDVD